MESQAIHKAASHMLQKMKWEIANGTEWRHSGVGPDFKEAMVQQQIHDFFPDGQIHLVIGRIDSKIVQTDEAASQVHQLLSGHSVALWDLLFSRVMFFDRIGVFKCSIGMA